MPAKKKFGQNFLHSSFHLDLLRAAVKKFLAKLEAQAILEIGPGQGALTDILLQESNLPILALEIDPEMLDFLRQKYQFTDQLQSSISRLDFRQTDALQVLSKTQVNLGLANRSVLISNLPYNVGSRILIELTLNQPEINSFLVMLQREVVHKLTRPGKRPTVLGGYLNLFWQMEEVAIFPRSAFSPQPKVESVLVAGYAQSSPLNKARSLQTVKALLHWPQKTVANNLRNLDWPRDQIQAFLSKHNYPKNLRLTSANLPELVERILSFV